jgi:hypothetical protein
MSWIIASIFLVIIGLLVWYIKNLIARIYFFIEDVKTIKKLTKDFAKHLDNIYAMELFYGEPVLEELIKHTKFLNKELKSFENVFDNIEVNNIKESVDNETEETSRTSAEERESKKSF